MKFSNFLLSLILMNLFLNSSLIAFSNDINLRKSPQDKREYGFITLENGLQAVLVSDPKAEHAAASLDVQVGSYQDPKDVPGLAHFLEHMLFLGSEKFPDPDEYSDYINRNGGHSNAFTAAERTNYHFSIDYNRFEGALDRFSQFFIAPLFDEKYTGRELQAVHAEHSKNLQNDFRRFFQVIKTIGNKNHPFSGFSTGNRETLEIHKDLPQRLKDFYQKYYSANIMKLTLVGRESIEVLEQYAKQYFSPVKNRYLDIAPYQEPIFLKTQLPAIVRIKPIKEQRVLTFMFPGPSQKEHYRQKPSSIISSMIGDESPGSLLSLLKKEGLANGLSAGGFSASKEEELFQIRIVLTKKGFKSINKITDYFFSYLALIQRKGLEKWRYEELQQIAKIDFEFLEKSPPLSTAIYLAGNQHDILPEDLLIAPYLYDSFELPLVKSFFNQLRPDNILILISDPDFSSNTLEKWYGTEYGIKPLPFDLLAHWQDIRYKDAPHQELHLPKKNLFIPENVSLKRSKEAIKNPQKIYDQNGVEFWFLQDATFQVPKVNLRASLFLPEAYASPKKSLMSKLLNRIWQEALNEFVYPAYLAGMSMKSQHSVTGVNFQIDGYPEKIGVLLKKILGEMQRVNISEHRFLDIRTQMSRQYKNDRFNGASQLAGYEFYTLGMETFWHREEYIDKIERISLAEVKNFSEELLMQGHLRVFLHGNVDRDDARQIHEIIKLNLPTAPLPEEQLPINRFLYLKAGEEIQYRFRVEEKDSAVLSIYQAEKRDDRSAVLYRIIQTLINKAFYHRLRTEEQLGYIVGSYPFFVEDIIQIAFVIQSPEKTPPQLEKRIQIFLEEYQEHMLNLSEKEFFDVRDALRNELSEPSKVLAEATAEYWNAIDDKDKNFRLNAPLLEALEAITLQDVATAYNAIFLSESKRHASIHAYGFEIPFSTDEKGLIEDRPEYKKNADYLEKISRVH